MRALNIVLIAVTHTVSTEWWRRLTVLRTLGKVFAAIAGTVTAKRPGRTLPAAEVDAALEDSREHLIGGATDRIHTDRGGVGVRALRHALERVGTAVEVEAEPKVATIQEALIGGLAGWTAVFWA